MAFSVGITGIHYSHYPNGQLETLAAMMNGELHGHYQRWHPNGRRAQEGTYAQGERVFLWRAWDEHGRLLGADAFHVGNSGFTRVVYYPSGGVHKVKEYRIYGGQRCKVGRHAIYYEDGSLQLVSHYGEDGMRNGPTTSYYKGGAKKTELTWLNGVLHGAFTMYFPHGGKRAEGMYMNGKLHDTYIEWSPIGILEKHVIYEDGEEVCIYEDNDVNMAFRRDMMMGVC